MAYIYGHRRLDRGEIFYIGIGTDKEYKRAYSKRSRNKHWKHVIAKVEYEVIIFEDGLTREQVLEKEPLYIKKYGRRDLNEGTLVNMTDGGEGLRNVSEEVKEKYRKLYKGKTFKERYGDKKAKEIGRKITTANTGQKRPKQSEKMKGRYDGEKNPMYGKTHTKEFKEARKEYFLSDKNPGKNKTEEVKRKISEAKKGIPSKRKGISRTKIKCPHCGKEGGTGVMQRWHFNNCKHKKDGKRK